MLGSLNKKNEKATTLLIFNSAILSHNLKVNYI